MSPYLSAELNSVFGGGIFRRSQLDQIRYYQDTSSIAAKQNCAGQFGHDRGENGPDRTREARRAPVCHWN